jgi:predicted PurR-regulated permease PerM
MESEQTRRVELLIAIGILVLLLLGCLLVLMPFVSAILWAAVLCLSTWPLYQRAVILVRGHNSIAALLMTIALAITVVAPFAIVGASIASNVSDVIGAIRNVIHEGPPQLPAFVVQIPFVGPWMSTHWHEFTSEGAVSLEQLGSFIDPLKTFLLKVGAAVGEGLLQVSLSLIICFFLYRDGQRAAQKLNEIVDRLVGERGLRLLEVARETIFGVVYGIIGTALAQAILAGIGFLIAGVPGALLLAFMTFVLAAIPIGPPLIWIPASVWLFWQGERGWGIFMAIWGLLIVSGSDNVIKPMLISRAGNTPLLLIMLGVFGGALAFGFIGLFLGPTLLAVGYSLLDDWISPSAPQPQLVRRWGRR